MKKLTTAAFKSDASITSSIAFLPSLISVAFFLFALFMLYFESTSLSTSIEKKIPFSVAKNEENARLILSTLSAGIISLTVFSFSMVMLVLSRASSNLTPRVIPGLTTARAHQVVLGFYIGSIIYTLILLISFKPDEKSGLTPAIAILIALVFGIICLALFVYFIHSISRSIQVDNILNSVFKEAYDALEHEEKLSEETKHPAPEKPEELEYEQYAKESGYLKEVDLERLQKYAMQHDLVIELLTEVGAFVVEKAPLFRLNKSLEGNQELKDKLCSCFNLSVSEVVIKDFEQGVKQISEIAVKALSPGINDPGSALKAIDFLTILFIRRIKYVDRNCFLDDRQQLRIIEKNITLDELMHRYLSPIRTYGKEDNQINLRLINCIENLLRTDVEHNLHTKTLSHHASAITHDADHAIHNRVDRIRLNERIEAMNKYLPKQLRVKELTILQE